MLNSCVQRRNENSLLEHLQQDDQQQAPWTCPRVASELKNEYDDIGHELPPENEPMETDETLLEPTHRHRQKRPMIPGQGGEQPGQRKMARNLSGELFGEVIQEAWWTQVDGEVYKESQGQRL